MPIRIGGQDYQIQDGHLQIPGSPPVPLVQGSDGLLRPVFADSEIEGARSEGGDNVRLLDQDKRVFVRHDLLQEEAEVARRLRVHDESIIRKLKPILLPALPSDLGALVVAANIVRDEDQGVQKEVIRRRFLKMADCYDGRGRMIYNLLRSGILANEILAFLKRLHKICGSDKSKVFLRFLPYWDAILTDGYPTAYFVGHDDSPATIRTQLDRRFEVAEVNAVYVYSRTR